MSKTHLQLILLSLFLFFVWSCKQDEELKILKYAVPDTPPINDTLRNVQIVWKPGEKKVSHDAYFAEYGRVRRYNGDTLLLVYHFGKKMNEWDNIAMRKSTDNGKTWLPHTTVVADGDDNRYSGFSTPDLLVLKNKWLMLAYTGRGIPDDSLHNNLQIRISKDGGNTWRRPAIVSLGRSWEPGMIQLPTGEIQLFYSNEILSTKNAKGRHEQKVLMISSLSNGHKWSKPRTVAFTPEGRDGMPIPLVLQEDKGILFVLEAVENPTSPEILWSSLKANWKYEELGSYENGRRWVSSIDPIWGGAPCIIQLPTGETIMSMQTEGGRKIERYTEWKKNNVVVMTGNSIGKNFNNLTFPYPDLPVEEGRYFNSIFLVNDTTLALLTTRNYPDDRSEVFWKEGRIYRRGR